MATPTSNSHASGAHARRSPIQKLYAATDRAVERFAVLPRAAKWGVLACLGMGGFFALDSFLWPYADALNARADRMQLVLNRAADRAEGLPSDVKRAALAYGPNSVPIDEQRGKDQLAGAIAEIFKKRGVNQGQDIRPAQSLPASVLADVAAARGGDRMGKSVAEVRFEGTPDAVLSIISDFESSASIDAIGDLRLNYNATTKRVGVQMTLEKWGVMNGSGGGV